MYGGNLDYQIVKVAKYFDYIFEMIELPSNRSQRRLKSIHEIRYDNMNHEISYHRICEYDFHSDSWTFSYDIGPRIEEIGEVEDSAALSVFKSTLESLAKKYPMKEKVVLKPVYSKGKACNEAGDTSG